MARTEANVGVFTFTQYLKPEYWPGWNEEELATLGQDAGAMGRVLVSRLEAAGVEIVGAYAIWHDKDTHEIFDLATKTMREEVKDTHIHFVAKVNPKVSKPLAGIAEILGIQSQYIEKAQNRYSYENFLAYLIHAKDPEKYQYDPAEVFTLVGEDFKDIAARMWKKWSQGRAIAQKKKATSAETVDPIIEAIIAGKLSREQLHLDPSMVRVYAANGNQIDNAFEAYEKYRGSLLSAKFKNGDFKTEVFYFHGEPGSGKTRLAKMFAEHLVRAAKKETGETWRIYEAASRNAMDDNRGNAEIVILDDFRAQSMTVEEWLGLLDPHNARPATARYSNVGNITPRFIFITSPYPPLKFFHYAKSTGNADEPMDQFMRRLAALITPVNAETGSHLIEHMGALKKGTFRNIGDTTYILHHGVVGESYAADVQEGIGILERHSRALEGKVVDSNEALKDAALARHREALRALGSFLQSVEKPLVGDAVLQELGEDWWEEYELLLNTIHAALGARQNIEKMGLDLGLNVAE